MFLPYKIEEAVPWALGLAAAVFGFLFGAFTPWMSVLFLAAICDWVAGSWASCRTPAGWSDRINMGGIAKKLGILMVLALCHAIDRATESSGNPGALQFVGTLWYVASEGLSLVKNLRKLGVPIFPGLGDALAGIGAKAGTGQEPPDAAKDKP